jgi:hypothetical protein
MSDRSVNSSKARRRLAPSEKYEIFVAVLTGQATQREAAANAGVDRSTVVAICRTAKQGALDALAASVPGRPGGGGDRPAAGGHRRAGGGVASARGKSVLGLSAGPVPPRVDGDVKVGLLELVDHAGDCGWPVRRACALLGLDDARYHHWAARRAAGRLDDLRPGGNPRHGILNWEREAIVELFEAWGGRPVASQARPPRLSAEHGARQRVHGAPCAGRRRPSPARQSTAGANPAHVVAAVAGVEAQRVCCIERSQAILTGNLRADTPSGASRRAIAASKPRPAACRTGC